LKDWVILKIDIHLSSNANGLVNMLILSQYCHAIPSTSSHFSAMQMETAYIGMNL
jgi:hypothetical protein